MTNTESTLSEAAADSGNRSPMARSLTRALLVMCFGSFMILAFLPLSDRVQSPAGLSLSPQFLLIQGLLICAACIATAASYYVLKRLEPLIDESALAQVHFLDALHPKYVDLAILFSAALSLFLELAIIRWQSTVFEFFAFYKNFSLLACFVGLGLGYALANRRRIALVLTIPLLAWQFAFMTIVRFGPHTPLRALPFREQLAMGIYRTRLIIVLDLYALLTIVFLITVLVFMPIGQLCGRLMEHQTKLRAYGLNLLGSLLGVLLMLLASFLWTPPLVWFMLCFLAILLFHLRRPAALIAGVVATAVCAIALVWPVNPLWGRVYSPYQLLEIGTNEDTGLTLISAAGHYYQRIYNFSTEQLPSQVRSVRDYYDLPYKAHPNVTDVLVVGAGTGNDVSASLRAGAGHVAAIEIDPAILMIGKNNHPERPYDNPRVHAVVNDARSFLRQTAEHYDMIVYGLLDSHTLLSHGSSVRLDSFVYTIEGLQEARRRLKPDGVISLSFSMMSDALGHKIYLMLQHVFDGRPPICVAAGYDRSVIYLESNDPNWTLPASLVKQAGFTDKTAFYADPSLHADLSTDDWPFFYMPERVYPMSYLIMVFQILVLSLMVAGNFLGERPRFSHLSYFFLGAGFMLVETKGITEMGLTFGNTWHVIGIVIAGILTMSFLGNCAVQWLNIRRSFIPYALLWAALALGWFVARSGGFASTPLGRLETAIILTCPLFFSGIVFSTLLTAKGQVSGMMASNLMGAVCGGLLEYNSMYFGFRSLYVVAMVCYVLAFLSSLLIRRNEPEAEPA